MCSRARSICVTVRHWANDIGAIPDGLYPGDYLKPVGAALAEDEGERYLSEPEAEWLPIFRARAVAAMMEMIRGDLALLGIHHDLFSSEAALQAAGKPEEAEKWLRAHDLVYDGGARSAQGQDSRRLGAGRAAAVPLDEIWRRPGPADPQVRRPRGPISAPISPITCRRPGAPDELIDIWGRRSCRHGQADQGRGRRFVRRRGQADPVRRQAGADGPAVAGRRAGQDVEALGQFHHHRRHGRGKWARTWCASPC